MLNLKEEFEELLSKEGYPVLLIKPNKKIRCDCFDSLTMSIDCKCPICLGTGFVSKVEKHTTMSFVASVPETLPRLIRQSEPSFIMTEARYFYFPTHVSPSPLDIVVICNFKGNVPLSPMSLYRINHVESYRLSGGAVQYYKASASYNPIETNIKTFNLRKSYLNKTNYIPVYE